MPNKKQRFQRPVQATAAFSTRLATIPAAAAALAAGIAGVAAAGAFLWSRRGQIGEALSSGMDRLSELKAERMGQLEPAQEEIAEEALTLKETGKKSRGPRGPLAQQDIKAGPSPVTLSRMSDQGERLTAPLSISITSRTACRRSAAPATPAAARNIRASACADISRVPVKA